MRSFSGIIELNEQEEALKAIGRFNLDWIQEILLWDPFLEAITHNGLIVNLYDDGSYYIGSRGLILSIQIVSTSIIVLY